MIIVFETSFTSSFISCYKDNYLKMKKITLQVKGMHCKSCSILIEDALEDLVVKSKVDNNKGTAIIEFDENKTNEEAIKKAIKAEGYKVE